MSLTVNLIFTNSADPGEMQQYAVPGGGGGYSDISYIRRLGSFFGGSNF